jgi:hypothetical protein
LGNRGEGKDRARIAYAHLVDGQLKNSFESSLMLRPQAGEMNARDEHSKEPPNCNTRPILSLLVKTILIEMLQANSLNVYCCAMMDKYFFEVAAYAS